MEHSQSYFQLKTTLNCRGKIIDLSIPKVMGIINVTPDSFHRSSRFMFRHRILRRAREIVNQGGSIIDIGACSTRPGSKPVPEKEELRRLDRAVSVIRKHLPNAIISIDTYRAAIARIMVENFGVHLINDISAGELDTAMFDTIAKLNVPYIMMHMQGTPQTMQENPAYKDVIKEIIAFFSKRVEKLNLLGVNDILLDPGFGFGKSIDHNYAILKNLNAFKVFNLPVVVGISRKSMIYKPLGITPDDALNGSSVLHSIALQNGVQIIRVHDVKQASDAIKLVNLYQSQETIA